MGRAHIEGAFEVVQAGGAAVFFTAEHASGRLPCPWRWPAADRRLIDTHWACDIGAGALTRQLAEALGGGAVLARFSRLLIDPNRPPDAPTLFRSIAEGEPVALNHRPGGAGLEPDERARRMAYWQAYHDAIEAALARATQARAMLSVHSFTPVYEGQRRPMEVGVLFDADAALADTIAAALRLSGFAVALNAPYSGRDGMMYAVDRHARANGLRGVELEVRQDLVVRGAVRARIVQALAKVAW